MNYEQHVQQNNDRLVCLKQALRNRSTFAAAANELLEWCSDPRAYQRQFEENVVGCLDIVRQVAHIDGFDLHLAHQLISAGSSHLTQIQPRFAQALQRWNRELSQLVLLRSSQLNATQIFENSGGDSDGNFAEGTRLISGMDATKMMQKTTLMTAPQQELMWQGGTGGAVSVLTTVYSGVPPSYNAGSHQGYSMSNMAATYNHNPHRAAGSMNGSGGGSVPMGGVCHQQQQHYDQMMYQGGAGPTFHHTAGHVSYNGAGSYQGPSNPSYQHLHESGPAYRQVSGLVYGPGGSAGKNGNVASNDLSSAAAANVAASSDVYYGGQSSAHWAPNGTGVVDYAPAAQQQQPPQAAAAAAAAMNAVQVAAAAVATATATAVALDQSQFHHQQYSQQNLSYCPQQQFSTSVGMVHQSQYMASPRVVPSRGVPAQMPPGYGMTASRGRIAAGSAPLNAVVYQNSQPSSKSQVASSSVPPPNNHSLQYPATMGGQRPYGPAPAYSAMRAGGPPTPVVNSMMRNAQYGAPQPGYSYGPPTPSYQQQQQRLYMNNNGPSVGLCGNSNPTPPMTPVHSSGLISPPGYASSLMVNNCSGMGSVDIKPMVNCQLPDDDILTLPVPDGVVMPPFRLEHNSPVTQHFFSLNDSMFNFLCSSPENDLQLKCFHQDEKVSSCNWPPNANVQICVNGTHVPLLNNNKPLYIKQLCQSNRNMLQISVQQCSCSHLFEVSLVQRISIENVRENLMRRKILPQDQAREKMKRLFFTGDLSNMRQDGHGADIEQLSISISLQCQVTKQKIRYPARGQMCRHAQCFDVETFLRMNKDKNKWNCPVCNIELHLDSLEIDQYIWGILCNFKDSSVDEITIDSALMWKANCRQPAMGCDSRVKIKEEFPGGCGNAKRFKNEAGVTQSANAWSPYSSGLPPTPSALAPTSVLSPSFGAAGSPAQPIAGQSQRRKSGGHGGKPTTPQSSRLPVPPNACLTSTSLASPLYTAAATPGTPTAAVYLGGSGGTPPSVGHPRSVGGVNGNPPSVELVAGGSGGLTTAVALHSQLSQPNGSSQADVCFASASAPYTPASVGSNGSLTHGSSSGGGTNVPSENYGQDLYGDLESLLTDSNPNDSSGLFADSMDPMELLKYLDNSDSSATANPNNIKPPKGVQKFDSAPSSKTSMHGAAIVVVDGSMADNSPTKNPTLYSNNSNSNFNDSSATRQFPSVDGRKQSDLTSLDDVLSFFN